MIIKNHHNKNRYILTSTGLWVRDYTHSAHPVDINHLTPTTDYDIFLENERANARLHLASIDAETIFAPNVIIVSDGYQFAEKQQLLKQFQQDKVAIIGTNRALAKWQRLTRLDYFIANNPYTECLSCLPDDNYYPRCIVSNRTNPDFVARYRARKGVLYRYSPVCDNRFNANFSQKPVYYIDDYRNPICAAVSLAYRWQVQKLLLFCCDDSFPDERPVAIKMENGLYMYPQHRISHGLIDGLLYWLTHQKNVKVKTGDHSSVAKYENADYIKTEDLSEFFL